MKNVIEYILERPVCPSDIEHKWTFWECSDCGEIACDKEMARKCWANVEKKLKEANDGTKPK